VRGVGMVGRSRCAQIIWRQRVVHTVALSLIAASVRPFNTPLCPCPRRPTTAQAYTRAPTHPLPRALQLHRQFMRHRAAQAHAGHDPRPRRRRLPQRLHQHRRQRGHGPQPRQVAARRQVEGVAASRQLPEGFGQVWERRVRAGHHYQRQKTRIRANPRSLRPC
jgi:hypothetical protein